MKRRLNNKGFTLVELLAVVVLLAVLMGVVATTVLNNVVPNARRKSLHTKTQKIAKDITDLAAADLLAYDDKDKILSSTFVSVSQGEKPNEWICISEYDANKLGLKTKDFIIDEDGVVPTDSGTKFDSTVCSAYKYNTGTGGYEVFLNANSEGDFYNPVDGKKNFSFNNATKSGEALITEATEDEGLETEE